jgi:hypothetical protein
MMRIMPDGTTNILINFPIVNGEFDPDLGIITDSGNLDITRVEKGQRVGFIKQQSFRVDQILNAITSDGKIVGNYKVTNINDKDDKMIIEDIDSKEKIQLDFNYQGIPIDLPFAILRIAPEETNYEESPQEAEAEAEAKAEDEGYEEYELPAIQVIETLQPKEENYPEISQKSDFKADLLSFLDEASRRNPLTVRRIRTLIEMFSSLKNSIIKRNTAGFVEGEEKISLVTLSDIISNRNVPIIRPVLETKRILMSEYSRTEENDSEQILIRHMFKVIEKSEEYLKTLGNIPPNELNPRWFQALSQYFTRFPLGIQYPFTGYSFIQDSEYFRYDIPGSDTLEGLVQPDKPLPGDKQKNAPNYYDGNEPKDFIGTIKQSLNRGHGPTVRGLEKGGTEIVIQADQAPVKGYVLFPYRAVLSGYIGATRTGVLWEQILRGLSEYKWDNDKESYKSIWMEKILSNLGGVSDVKDAQNILYIERGSINVSFSAYLKMILDTIVIRGSGDLTSMKSDLGISDMELTSEQSELVNGRVQEVIASLRTMIRRMREPHSKPAPVLNPIIESKFVETVNDIASVHPEIVILLKQLSSKTPGYKMIDVAVFSYLYSKAQDYILACLSNNVKKIESELKKYKKNQLQEILKNAYIERNLEEEKGFPPEPNPCRHTNNLTVIRKIKNSTERISLLANFLNKYKGSREENWINCNVCDKHLLCHHELLQIRQFLRPREHAAIQKEIVLGYAGGTFGRNYICRNCGLPIAEMEFDTSIEFDDDGKPMSGRSEMVDEDQKEKEELEDLLGAPIIKQKEIVFETSLKTELYRISRVICDLVGVSFSDITYRELVDSGDSLVRQTIVDEKTYIDSKKDKKTYKPYQTRSKIALCAALVLITIQKRIPDYVIQPSVGCKSGIGGYPLISDAKPDSPNDSTGIHYIVCLLTDFIPQFQGDLAEIWFNGFHRIKKDDRQKIIFAYMNQKIKEILELDSKVQTDLEKKRKYIEELYGIGASSIRPVESITPGFLPRMERVEEATEAAAKEPTIAEGIKQGNEQLADAWIRAANRIAKNNSTVVKGNPYAVISCCPATIVEPGAFWKNTELPSLPKHIFQDRGFLRQTILYPPFIPRDLIVSNAEPSLEVAYRVYLQICWKGERIGRTHELGHDNKCEWCDLEIPINYLYPDMPLSNPTWNEKRAKEEEEKEEAKEAQLIEEIKLSLTNQGITFTQESLQSILDASHDHTLFTTYYSPNPIEPTKLLGKIAQIDEAPIENWETILMETMNRLRALKSSADEFEIAISLKTLRDGLKSSEDRVQENVNLVYNIFKSILKESPAAIIEIIRSYLLVPIQRIYSNYSEIHKNFTMGDEDSNHEQELDVIIDNHTNYLKKYNEDNILSSSDLGITKLGYYVAQLSALLKFSSELRISRMGFDDKLTQLQMEMFLNEILRVILFGPLGDLLNPNFIPEVEDETDLSLHKDTVHREIYNLITDLLVQYKRERLSYNPTEVREKIAEAKEIEKQGFIRKFDVLDEEDRKIELIKKRLKIGRWSQGNGKLAYSYDAENWDRMRTERNENIEVFNAAQNMDPFATEFDEGGEGEGYEGQDDQQKEEGEE